jgi:hypothetical protein
MKKNIRERIPAFCFTLLLVLTTTAIQAETSGSKPELTGPPTTLLSYDHLYVGEDGETHFKTVTVDYKRFNYADNIPPIWAALNGKWNAQYLMLAGNSPGWDARPLHPPRHRQIFIVLTGTTAFVASDGETREYGPGQMILMEDNNSKGHGSFVPSKGNSMVAIIPLHDK